LFSFGLVTITSTKWTSGFDKGIQRARRNVRR